MNVTRESCEFELVSWALFRWYAHSEVCVMKECISMIAQRRPVSGILENVEGFGHSPANEMSAKDWCLQELHKLDYSADAVSTCLSSFLPCTRQRTSAFIVHVAWPSGMPEPPMTLGGWTLGNCR